MPIGNVNLGQLKAHADKDYNKALFPHEASSIGYNGGSVGDALTNLEDIHVKQKIYEDITATITGLTGTVEGFPPTTIDTSLLDGSAYNAEIRKTNSDGSYSGEAVFTAGTETTRTRVFAEIDSSGDYIISGTPDPANYPYFGIVYVRQGNLKEFGEAKIPSARIRTIFYDSGTSWDAVNNEVILKYLGASLNLRNAPIKNVNSIDLYTSHTLDPKDASIQYDNAINRKGIVLYDEFSSAGLIPPAIPTRSSRVMTINETGRIIPKGTVICSTGLSATSQGLFTACFANNTDKSQAESILGVSMYEIPAGSPGTGVRAMLARFSVVTAYDTSAFEVNDLLYLGLDGVLTNVRPTKAGQYPVRLGIVAVKGVSGVIGVEASSFDGTDTSNSLTGILNGIVLETPQVDFSVSGGIIYADVTNEYYPLENLPFILDGVLRYLDTTTNTGPGGSARIIIPPGASNVLTETSHVYIYLDNGVPTLGFSSAEPSIVMAKLFRTSVYDDVRTLADGKPKSYRRNNNAIDLLGGPRAGAVGLVTDVVNSLRRQGSSYNDGMAGTSLVDDTQIRLSLTAGIASQFRTTTTPAFDGLSYKIYNDNANLVVYEDSTNLIDITETADGSSLLGNNRYYTIRLYYQLNSNGIGNDIIATRPLNYYITPSGAVADGQNYTTLLNDPDTNDIVFPLYDLVLSRTGGLGATINLIQLTDLRSSSTAGGGGATGQGTDDKVRISANDVVNDYLDAKLVVDSTLTKSILNPGINEQIQHKINLANANTYTAQQGTALVPVSGNDYTNKTYVDGLDALVVHKAGAETITGVKTVTGDIELDGLITRSSNTNHGADNETHVCLATNSETGLSSQNRTYITISGGEGHWAPSDYATISGGKGHNAPGSYGSIIGGLDCGVQNYGVAGGKECVAGNSSVSLGEGNKVLSDYSSGWGRNVNLHEDAHGSHVVSNATSLGTLLTQVGVFFMYPYGSDTLSVNQPTADKGYSIHTGRGIKVDGVVYSASAPTDDNHLTNKGYVDNLQKTIKVVTTTPYNLLASDFDKILHMNGTTEAQTIVIPLNATEAIATGKTFEIFRLSAFDTIFEGETVGVTLLSELSYLMLASQNTGALIRKIDTDTSSIIGSLS